MVGMGMGMGIGEERGKYLLHDSLIVRAFRSGGLFFGL